MFVGNNEFIGKAIVESVEGNVRVFFCAEDKNEWSYTSTASCTRVERDDFPFAFTCLDFAYFDISPTSCVDTNHSFRATNISFLPTHH
jgi:hypothetical protein